MLSGEVAKRYGHAGLPDDTISVASTGTAGQSFGALLAHGITLDLDRRRQRLRRQGLVRRPLIVRPPTRRRGIAPEEHHRRQHCALRRDRRRGYFRGVAGERFAVRNSGAVAVVEGTGDHGCEYMTGGVVVVLGPTGRNFAAGMSGGIAYVLDEDGNFEQRCNLSMVDLEPVEAEEEVMRQLSNQGGDLESHGLVDVMGDMTEPRCRTPAPADRPARPLHQFGAGRTILDNWAEYQRKFKKVMPVEYRRALAEMGKQQAADKTGFDVLEIGLRARRAKIRRLRKAHYGRERLVMKSSAIWLGNCLRSSTRPTFSGCLHLDADRGLKGDTRTPEFVAIVFRWRQIPRPWSSPMAGASRQSNGIVRYLARAAARLLPADPFVAAKVDELLFWEQYSHEPYLARLPLSHASISAQADGGARTAARRARRKRRSI